MGSASRPGISARTSSWNRRASAGGMRCIAGTLPEGRTVALAGGGAMIVHEFVSRETPVHGVFGWDGALIAFAYQCAREAGVGTELDL